MVRGEEINDFLSWGLQMEGKILREASIYGNVVLRGCEHRW